MEVSDFFHVKLEKYVMSVEKCKLHLCSYVLTSDFGVPNVSKELFLTLLKFHGKVPSNSEYIKTFRLGR